MIRRLIAWGKVASLCLAALGLFVYSYLHAEWFCMRTFPIDLSLHLWGWPVYDVLVTLVLVSFTFLSFVFLTFEPVRLRDLVWGMPLSVANWVTIITWWQMEAFHGKTAVEVAIVMVGLMVMINTLATLVFQFHRLPSK